MCRCHPLLLCLHLALWYRPVGARPFLKLRGFNSVIVLHIHTVTTRLLVRFTNDETVSISAIERTALTVLSRLELSLTLFLLGNNLMTFDLIHYAP